MIDSSKALELSQWLYKCKNKGWKWDDQAGSVIFQKSHLRDIEKDVTDFVKSSGITTPDSARQILVTGVEALKQRVSEAWDGQDLDDWARKPPGSEAVSSSKAFQRLLDKYQLSELLTSTIADASAGGAAPEISK